MSEIFINMSKTWSVFGNRVRQTCSCSCVRQTCYANSDGDRRVPICAGTPEDLLLPTCWRSPRPLSSRSPGAANSGGAARRPPAHWEQEVPSVRLCGQAYINLHTETLHLASAYADKNTTTNKNKITQKIHKDEYTYISI